MKCKPNSFCECVTQYTQVVSTSFKEKIENYKSRRKCVKADSWNVLYAM